MAVGPQRSGHEPVSSLALRRTAPLSHHRFVALAHARRACVGRMRSGTALSDSRAGPNPDSSPEALVRGDRRQRRSSRPATRTTSTGRPRARTSSASSISTTTASRWTWPSSSSRRPFRNRETPASASTPWRAARFPECRPRPGSSVTRAVRPRTSTSSRPSSATSRRSGAACASTSGSSSPTTGYEVIDGYDGFNDNATRSFVFGYAIPFTHTGLKASYTFSDQVAGMLMLCQRLGQREGQQQRQVRSAPSSSGPRRRRSRSPATTWAGPSAADTNGDARNVGQRERPVEGHRPDCLSPSTPSTEASRMPSRRARRRCGTESSATRGSASPTPSPSFSGASSSTTGTAPGPAWRRS